MEWWVYVIIFAGLIAVWLLSSLVVYQLMKKAQKKAYLLFDKVIPKEKERYQVILKAKDRMEKDGRFLPKNMVDSTMEVDKEFQKIPCDIAKIKGMDDFLVIYYRKYIKEKKLSGKYHDIDMELEACIFLDPSDKRSPYYEYNKAALHYNAYVNMGFLNLFRGKAKLLPTL